MEDDKGEVFELMGDIKREATNMLEDLQDIDSSLTELENRIKDVDQINKEELLGIIETIRIKIGTIEKEDKRELEEEEIANNLLSKLKKWVDTIV